jgi:polyhydroxyalkanoate synthesis regulator phasin
MPQPRKKASPAPTRKPAARKPAARKPAARKPAPRKAKPASAAAPPAPAATDDLAANLGALRERLVSSLTLTTDRLQDAVDDAVRRGRMTRKDAEELLSTLVSAGRAQTEALLADVEQLLGRGGSGDAVLRTVDRARRRVGVGSTFPILGYDDLTAPQVGKRLADLTPAQLRKVRDYERRNGKRKSVLAAIERKLG